MEISVDFDDGRIREFNTQTYAAAEPFKGAVPNERGARNFVTEFDLRLDLLSNGFLRLDLFYDTFGDSHPSTVVLKDDISSDPELKVVAAVKHVCGSVFLLTEKELAHARYILVRRCGEPVAAAWRQGSGDWLIDGQRFAMAARQVYSDAQVTSRNAQELIMVNYLSNAYPDLSEEEVCEMTGYPHEAYLELREMEFANAAATQETPAAAGAPREREEPEEPERLADSVDAPPDGGTDEPDSLIPAGVDFDDDED